MHARLGGREFFLRHLAGAHVFRHLPHARARADLLAFEMPGEHRPTRNADRRQIAARRAHEQRRRGLVTTHEQHDAIHRVAANRFFDIHAREIAEQHRGGLQLRFAQRHHGKFERESAGFEHTAFYKLRYLAEVAVTWREFAPGIADTDDRAAVEHIVGIALVLEPASMDESILVLLAE